MDLMSRGACRAAVAAATLLFIVGSTSCKSDLAVKPEPDVGEILVVAAPGDVVLPLTAYMYTNELYGAMMMAHRRLAAACMARFGVYFPTLTEAIPGLDFPDFSDQNVRRYGLFDMESAQVRGYNPPPSASDATSTDRSGGAIDFTEQQLFLLQGKSRPGYDDVTQMPLDKEGRALPESGCAGEASALLTEGRHDPLQATQEYANEAYASSTVDSRVRAAVGEWSRCMATRGYRYAEVMDPNNQAWPEPPGDTEIATATADVGCKIETNLVGVWSAVEAAYQRRIIEQNPEHFAGTQRFLETVDRNAARVLAEG
jgi:hypothetical protein